MKHVRVIEQSFSPIARLKRNVLKAHSFSFPKTSPPLHSVISPEYLNFEYCVEIKKLRIVGA